MSGAARRFPLGVYIFLLVLIVILGCLPLIAFVAAAVMEPLFGCTRGIVSLTCTGGWDGVGGLIDSMGLSGWLFLFTAPIASLLFAVWLGVLVIHAANFSGRRRTPAA